MRLFFIFSILSFFFYSRCCLISTFCALVDPLVPYVEADNFFSDSKISKEKQNDCSKNENNMYLVRKSQLKQNRESFLSSSNAAFSGWNFNVV